MRDSSIDREGTDGLQSVLWKSDTMDYRRQEGAEGLGKRTEPGQETGKIPIARSRVVKDVGDG